MGTKTAQGVSRTDAFMADPDRFTLVGAKPYTGHPSDTDDGPGAFGYDERVMDLKNLDPNEVKNVAMFGVKVPIIAHEEPDGRLIVIAGRHRVAWARAANKMLEAEGSALRHKIKFVREKMDEKTALGVMVSENEVRKNDDVLVKARKLVRLIGAGYTIEDAATTFGVSKQTVRNYQALATAHGEVHKAVEAGRIGVSAAFELAKLPRNDQPTALARILEGNATAREAKLIVGDHANGGGSDAPPENEGGPTGPMTRSSGPAPLVDGKRRATVEELRRVYDYLSKDPTALKGIHCSDFLAWQLGHISYKAIAGLASTLRAAGVIKATESGKGRDD